VTKYISKFKLFGQFISISIALLLSVFATYATTLDAPLTFDDLNFFSTQVASRHYEFFSLSPRWLSHASLSWTVSQFGMDMHLLRFGNILLHAINSILLYVLLRRLFHAVLLADRDAGISGSTLNGYALMGSMIFALHPVAVYGVTYLIQRSILLATMFMLLMLLAYLEGLLREKWEWMVAAGICYFAAIMSKEHSVMAPVVALALTPLIRKPSLNLFKQTLPFYILLLVGVVVGVTLLSARGVIGQAYEPNALILLEHYVNAKGLTMSELPDLHLLSLVTQATLFFKYIFLWLLPNPAWMSVDMREPIALSIFAWPHAFGMSAFLAYFGLSVWLLLKRGRLGLLGFAMLAPWIMYLTEMSTVRIKETFVLYRSYLWMPMLFVAIPALVGKLKASKVFALMGILCLVIIPLTLNRMHTFSSVLLLWDDAEKLVRHKQSVLGVERIYYNRGTELGKLGRFEEAIADFNRAIDEHPFESVFGNRATAYYFLGRYREALSDYDRAIAFDPSNPNSYQGRGLTLRALGDYAQAQLDFQKSCELGLCSPN